MGCRRTTAAAELVRVARTADGGLRIGPGPGRGAWLCPDAACVAAAAKRRAFPKALRGAVADEAIAALRVAIAG
ncbi:YlxR family protein [Iamia sp. SCSIO 61187]|uniref:YlxR family protein n=1 Tax=Iamia sp. SCSIO 61187 TaxID=2722752 RepID=UPI0021056B4B|nr:YlxR family protein [Iamia sp. SCSIO 61187]